MPQEPSAVLIVDELNNFASLTFAKHQLMTSENSKMWQKRVLSIAKLLCQ
jgi:hypothetical protein